MNHVRDTAQESRNGKGDTWEAGDGRWERRFISFIFDKIPVSLPPRGVLPMDCCFSEEDGSSTTPNISTEENDAPISGTLALSDGDS